MKKHLFLFLLTVFGFLFLTNCQKENFAEVEEATHNQSIVSYKTDSIEQLPLAALTFSQGETGIEVTSEDVFGSESEECAPVYLVTVTFVSPLAALDIIDHRYTFDSEPISTVFEFPEWWSVPFAEGKAIVNVSANFSDCGFDAQNDYFEAAFLDTPKSVFRTLYCDDNRAFCEGYPFGYTYSGSIIGVSGKIEGIGVRRLDLKPSN